MRFTPKAESEVSKGFKPLNNGTYPFTVMESGIKLSKSEKNKGREMFSIKINVHGADFDKHVYDVFADWFSEWKLKHFLEVIGLGAEYESGYADPSGNAYQGRTGYVKLGIEVNKENGEERNYVVDYIVQKTEPAPTPKPAASTAKAKTAAANAPVSDDDVPF